MERLTFRNGGGIGWPHEWSIWKLVGKLADYEDAEEEGRLIKFPVAIGDHVWCFPSEAEPYREMQVVGLSCDFGAKYIQVQDVITTETVYFNTENLGRSMFISREQAQAKLKEMEVDSHGDS